MTAVRALKLPDTASTPGYDHLDPISQWFLGGTTAGADASGIVDDDRYGLNVRNVGTGGLSLMALSGDGGRFLRVDNTAVAIGGGLSITGPTTFSSSVTIGGTLDVTGAATFRSSLTASGAATFASSAAVGGALNVTGPATFVTNVTMNQGLTVDQSAVIKGNLTATGSVSVGATLAVTGAATFVTAVQIQGVLSADSTVNLGNGTGDTTTIAGDIDHNGNNIGFFGSTPSTKETVTGSKAGNAALDSLLSALANYGLITDSTT